MRCNIYLILLTVFEIALAVSFSGSRLLVVTDNESDKGKFSKLFADLDCMFRHCQYDILPFGKTNLFII